MNGYVLSKPIQLKITQTVFIDDRKMFPASDKKLYPALQSTNVCIAGLNMEWGIEKCAVMNVKRGILDDESVAKLNDSTTIRSVDNNRPYKFLGIYEHLGQDEIMIREGASKEFLQRVWLIWSSPLSDALKVQATNTFAMSALSYFMTTTEWIIYEVQEFDRQVRKILKDNKGRHPCASVHFMYLPRSMGGKGLKSIEQEYKEWKIKTTLHLHTSTEQAVKAAAQARRTRERKSLMKDAEKYAEELAVDICKDSND